MYNEGWIPNKELELVTLCASWKVSLEDPAKLVAYGWDQGEVTEIADKINAFLTAQGVYKADNSTAKRILKDEAKKKAVDAMRNFANSSVRYNKKIDDAAKLNMGIRPKDMTPTAHGRPTSQPDTVVENTSNHFEHKIRALHAGNAAKPLDAYGVCFVWQLGGEKPASGANIREYSKFSRKTFLVVTYTEADKGKVCYYSTCYENSKGEQGPWSPVEEAVIG
ncbi:MAG: hypothetical protein LBK00_10100 [Treponema sp.]|nr:hypothetical protein [Treponema sp.]